VVPPPQLSLLGPTSSLPPSALLLPQGQPIKAVAIRVVKVPNPGNSREGTLDTYWQYGCTVAHLCIADMDAFYPIMESLAKGSSGSGGSNGVSNLRTLDISHVSLTCEMMRRLASVLETGKLALLEYLNASGDVSSSSSSSSSSGGGGSGGGSGSSNSSSSSSSSSCGGGVDGGGEGSDPFPSCNDA